MDAREQRGLEIAAKARLKRMGIVGSFPGRAGRAHRTETITSLSRTPLTLPVPAPITKSDKSNASTFGRSSL